MKKFLLVMVASIGFGSIGCTFRVAETRVVVDNEDEPKTTHGLKPSREVKSGTSEE